MKIFVLGSGGREHALVWKLRQSRIVEHIWCGPGNGGISVDAECVPAELKNVSGLADLAARFGADLTVVGPELPLVLGVVDAFTQRGLKIVGPTRAGAKLEGSKVFAKQFMERHGIPTAPLYGIYDSAVDAYAALCAVDWPLVVKADGLCAGKGVLVTSSPDEATAFIERVMERKVFGEAGEHVLLEEGLTGKEVSYIVLTDGENWVPMVSARDYKRAFNGDQGPNTGGMGAFSRTGLLSANLEKEIQDKIVRPTIAGLGKENRRYRGFLYFGLMLTPEGPKVLEFNCRSGDPETQAIVLRMNFDLAEALDLCAKGNLREFEARWKPDASVCVVLASEGYPGVPITGRQIEGLGEVGGAENVVVFHAGTRRDGFTYYTSGGRVVGVTALGQDLEAAVERVYDRVSSIQFAGCHFRSDIGKETSGRGLAAGDAGRG